MRRRAAYLRLSNSPHKRSPLSVSNSPWRLASAVAARAKRQTLQQQRESLGRMRKKEYCAGARSLVRSGAYPGHILRTTVAFFSHEVASDMIGPRLALVGLVLML